MTGPANVKLDKVWTKISVLNAEALRGIFDPVQETSEFPFGVTDILQENGTSA